MTRHGYFNKTNYNTCFRKRTRRDSRVNRIRKKKKGNSKRKKNKVKDPTVNLKLFIEEHQKYKPSGYEVQHRNIRLLTSVRMIHWIVHNLTDELEYDNNCPCCVVRKKFKTKRRRLISFNEYYRAEFYSFAYNISDAVLNLIHIHGRYYNPENAIFEVDEMARLTRINADIVLGYYGQFESLYDNENGIIGYKIPLIWRLIKMLARTDELENIVDYVISNKIILEPLIRNWVFINSTFSKLYYYKLYRQEMEHRVVTEMLPKKHKCLPEIAGHLIASYL